MSRFQKYVLRLDDVVEGAIKIANDLNANYNTAKQKCEFYRADRLGEPSRGALDPDNYVAALEWRAKLAAAEQQKSKFWANLPEQTAQKISEIRADFARALDDAYSADPSRLDAATLTLLEADICDAHEYERLLNKAMKNDNPTLARVIGSYANKTAEKVERDTVYGGEYKADEYRAIAITAADFGRLSEKFLAAFDSYAYAIERATENPDMLNGDNMATFSADTLTAFDKLG